jgi:hypothetical protein
MSQVSPIAVDTALNGPSNDTPLTSRYPYRDRGDDAYYTLKQAADFLTDRGFPITPRYLGKIAAPGSGIGPSPDRRFGGRCLYLGSTLLAWAKARSDAEANRKKIARPR